MNLHTKSFVTLCVGKPLFLGFAAIAAAGDKSTESAPIVIPSAVP